MALAAAVNYRRRVFSVLLPGARLTDPPSFLDLRTRVDLSSYPCGLQDLIAGIRGEYPEANGLESERRRLSERLTRLYDDKDRLEELEKDTTKVVKEILMLKRELRSGPELAAGDILGERYRLLTRLGSGGFATVWQAYDRHVRMRVAVKILHGQYARDHSAVERFVRGARVMAGLKHPGIVRILDPDGSDGGHRFFIMEYVAGTDLQNMVGTDVETDRILSILDDVADAVGSCHTKGIIHRDIKPSNILIQDDGSIKLTDFDLVSASDTTGGTRSGVLGTIAYAAPECLSNPAAADARADVYSLSMTAVALLRGRLPELTELFNPEKLVSGLGVSADIRRVLRSGVEVSPDERPANAYELMIALRKARGGATPNPLRNRNLRGSSFLWVGASIVIAVLSLVGETSTANSGALLVLNATTILPAVTITLALKSPVSSSVSFTLVLQALNGYAMYESVKSAGMMFHIGFALFSMFVNASLVCTIIRGKEWREHEDFILRDEKWMWGWRSVKRSMPATVTDTAIRLALDSEGFSFETSCRDLTIYRRPGIVSLFSASFHWPLAIAIKGRRMAIRHDVPFGTWDFGGRGLYIDQLLKKAAAISVEEAD